MWYYFQCILFLEVVIRLPFNEKGIGLGFLMGRDKILEEHVGPEISQ
jgi:hypothetical protein